MLEMFHMLVQAATLAAIVCITAYLLMYSGRHYKYGGAGGIVSFGSLLPETPAIDAFLMFLLQAAMISVAVIVCCRAFINTGFINLFIPFCLSAILVLMLHIAVPSEILPMSKFQF